MTAPDVDPVWQFIQGLPANVRRSLNRTERLVVLIHRATRDQGWTVPALVKEAARDHNGAVNAAALVMHRLENAATNPPASNTGPRRVPFCTPECRDNAGLLLDPETRLPTGKCPCRNAEVSA